MKLTALLRERRDRGPRLPERFTVSIAVHEDYIVARAAGELDYQFADLLHHQVKDSWQCVLRLPIFTSAQVMPL
ncbi:hypothetical protein AB0392_15765 [Nonomuraea angiospora]|uniref:hypothetical protein n=1 Tax=Nonomuraea angiospora TaxID=46172 RepID=UPI00344EECBE